MIRQRDILDVESPVADRQAGGRGWHARLLDGEQRTLVEPVVAAAL